MGGVVTHSQELPMMLFGDFANQSVHHIIASSQDYSPRQALNITIFRSLHNDLPPTSAPLPPSRPHLRYFNNPLPWSAKPQRLTKTRPPSTSKPTSRDPRPHR